MPNTDRRRRRNETVELHRVGGVNTLDAPVGSRDPVYNISCSDKWRHNDVIGEKVIKIHDYNVHYTADSNV